MRVFFLFAAILVTGCASYSHSDVQPDDAAEFLRVGDWVQITRKDDTTASVTIKDISGTEISGSLRTNIFLREVSIPFSEIGSIRLYTRDSFESQVTPVFIGAVLGLVAVNVIFSN